MPPPHVKHSASRGQISRFRSSRANVSRETFSQRRAQAQAQAHGIAARRRRSRTAGASASTGARRRSRAASQPDARAQRTTTRAGRVVRGHARISGRRNAWARARARARARIAGRAVTKMFGFDQNFPRISFQKQLFGHSVASFFGFDQMSAARLVKTANSCQRRAEKRGSRCEIAPPFGQNRKFLPRPFYRLAPEADATGVPRHRRMHAPADGRMPGLQAHAHRGASAGTGAGVDDRRTPSPLLKKLRTGRRDAGSVL